MASDRLRVEVLGPIRVIDAAGIDRTPDGGLQRRLLALLVLHRGRLVSTGAAIEALWPTRVPQNPTAALQTHVFRLRRGLPEEMIESTADGYRLNPPSLDVDADRLAEMIAGDGEQSALGAILDRWRGPAFPELADTDDGRAEAQRLEELRVRAREVRASWRLACGDTDGLVAELSSLIDAERLRERPRELLMEVLVASGRRAEALRVYDDFRRLLGEEMGIEPSGGLTARHGELLAAEAAPTQPGRLGRLPAPTTSLVGRDDLATDLTNVVDHHRLVCLVGPGGVGKTQLAIEVGWRLARARPSRPVVLCELALADGGSAVDVVAAALGIDARPGMPLGDRVPAVVGDDELILFVDNCEHVLGPVAQMVDRLLRRCPNVRILATSRERLRLPGERVVVVPPLGMDGDDSPATTLFVERARAVRPAFSAGAPERAVIAEIVRQLDGLPLAIELAAACLHTRDLEEVAAGLDRRFALLTTGSRASPRHESLGAAVNWSYGLLDEPLRMVFRGASVFVGPFSVDDAAAACAWDVPSAAGALAQLVERSLVQRTTDRRYILLQTLRAFGVEQLAATDEAEVVGERHARHMVKWAERADDRLSQAGEPAIVEIDAAIPELRAALVWLLDNGHIELAGRLVTALLYFGLMRLRPDVLAWSKDVSDADPNDRSPVAPLVWVAAAYGAWMTGDIEGARKSSARAMTISERVDAPPPPMVPTICGTVALISGQLDDAVQWYRRAVDVSSPGSPQRVFAAASELLPLGYAGHPDAPSRAERLLAEIGDLETARTSYVWYCAGETVLGSDIELARARLSRAIELAERTGAAFVTGVAGASRASLAARFGDPVTATDEYRALIDLWRRAGIWSTQWTMLRSIAGLLERLGHHRDAAVLAGAVERANAGHRVFGADEVTLTQLSVRLRAALGDGAFETASAEGGVLDGEAAVEHTRRSLGGHSNR